MNELDQFYTNENIAKKCLNILKNKVNIDFNNYECVRLACEYNSIESLINLVCSMFILQLGGDSSSTSYGVSCLEILELPQQYITP